MIKLSIFLEEKIHPVMFIVDLIKSYRRYRKEKRFGESLGIKPINAVSYQSSIGFEDTFFVLGGASINELTKEMWRQLDESTTIGINHWFIHPFEPNFLMFEGLNTTDVDCEFLAWRESMLSAYMRSTSTILLSYFYVFK